METGRLPSKEEIELIHRYILLPMCMDIVEKNITKMELSRDSLKPLYIRAAQALQDTIHRDLVKVRADMKKIGIKVWEDTTHRDFTTIRYKYQIRGYIDEFGMMREVVRSRLSVLLGGYIDGMFK